MTAFNEMTLVSRMIETVAGFENDVTYRRQMQHAALVIAASENMAVARKSVSALATPIEGYVSDLTGFTNVLSHLDRLGYDAEAFTPTHYIVEFVSLGSEDQMIRELEMTGAEYTDGNGIVRQDYVDEFGSVFSIPTTRSIPVFTI